jgi:hypothetical protein
MRKGKRGACGVNIGMSCERKIIIFVGGAGGVREKLSYMCLVRRFVGVVEAAPTASKFLFPPG